MHITLFRYNGFPQGCSDEVLPWDRTSVTGDQLDTKVHPCHMELSKHKPNVCVSCLLLGSILMSSMLKSTRF